MSDSKRVYPYIPNSVPEVKAQMLKEVGAKDIMDLYVEIPEALRFKGKLNLPEPIHDEYSLRRHLEDLLGRNKNCAEYLNFLGAGCAQHFVPAVCDEINGRGGIPDGVRRRVLRGPREVAGFLRVLQPHGRAVGHGCPQLSTL